MQNGKTVISIFTTTWGHQSIAKAIDDTLHPKYKVYFNFIKPDAVSFKSYNLQYILFPSVNIIPKEFSRTGYISKITLRHLYKSYITKIETLVKNQKPKVIISTYFAFTYVLEKLSKKYHFTLINITANPRSFHRLETALYSYNFVFDGRAEKRCRSFGTDKKLIVKCGWFVRREFQKPENKEVVRLSLGLKPKLFTISVIGGSEGTLNILKIIPAFFSTDKKIQVVFICGKNRSLYHSLSAFFKVLELNKHRNTAFSLIGYTENTHKYLQASDLVIGKAGPNLLFEAVATRIPFFAISHIAGPEDGNLEIIRNYKLGFVEENPIKAIKLTQKIINNPKMLDWFQKPLTKMAEKNNGSHQILLDFINKKLQGM
jgi:UDP-N-acetylglucosamine:LPS N-acetylglucosamine transferase